MGQTITNLAVHIIFSTKDRMPSIETEIRQELFAYIGGVVHAVKAKPIIINGTNDHIHLLVEILPALSVSELVKSVKANSSRWIHQSDPLRSKFAWQTGYGAFSVSKSVIPTVIKYIQDQEIHHQKQSFQAEFLAFLKKHDLEYDEKYIWQ